MLQVHEALLLNSRPSMPVLGQGLPVLAGTGQGGEASLDQYILFPTQLDKLDTIWVAVP